MEEKLLLGELRDINVQLLSLRQRLRTKLANTPNEQQLLRHALELAADDLSHASLDIELAYVSLHTTKGIQTYVALTTETT